ICVRVASDYRRRAPRRREVVTDEPPEQRAEGGPEHDFARAQARKILDAALARLDDDKRAVFVLYEIEELTMAEVAEIVSAPLQTAYSRLHAARKLVEAFVREAREGTKAP